MHAGVIRITYTILETLLHLPPGTHITRTFEDPARWRDNTLHLVLEGDGVPMSIPEGALLPYLTLRHHSDADGIMNSTLHGD